MKKPTTGTPDMMSAKVVRDVLGGKYDFPGLVRSVATHKKFELSLPPRMFPIVSPDELVGIEIEVEGIRYPETYQYYWKHKADGSLRNYGAEYASIPLRADQVEWALLYWNELIRKNNTPDFSQRTSTHIHLNVRNMTWEEIENMVLLYMIFERHFFLQTNKDREHSIFCVPLYKTDKCSALLPVEHASGNWQKYAALNISTILGGESPMFGTIEFRHLHGTADPSEIVPWINNILRLKQQALKMEAGSVRKMLATMNTTSEYLGLYTQTFGEQAQPQAMQKADFEYCITMTKLGVFCSIAHYDNLSTKSIAYQKSIDHSKSQNWNKKAKIFQVNVPVPADDPYEDLHDEVDDIPMPPPQHLGNPPLTAQELANWIHAHTTPPTNWFNPATITTLNEGP